MIASRVGTFLYPRESLEPARPFAPNAGSLGTVAAPSDAPRLRRSRCSAVSCSLPDVAAASVPSLFEPAGELERCDERAGDAERVVGGCTVVESAALELVATELVDVRASSDVARRGRTEGCADVKVLPLLLLLLVLLELGGLFEVIRAASWFSEGILADAAGREAVLFDVGATEASSCTGTCRLSDMILVDWLTTTFQAISARGAYFSPPREL